MKEKQKNKKQVKEIRNCTFMKYILLAIGCNLLLGLTTCINVTELTLEEIEWEKELIDLQDTLATLEDDFEKTSFLRQYCGGLMDTGVMQFYQKDALYPIVWEEVDMSKWYALFKADTLPVACGVISVFYGKLLEACGYTSYTYSCGWEDSPIVHTFTLVELPKSEKIIIQDATLNSTLIDINTQKPADFLTFLKDVKSGKNSCFMELEDTVFTKSILPPNKTFNISNLKKKCKEGLTLISQDSAFLIIPFPRSSNNVLRNSCLKTTFEDQIIEKLVKEGKPANLFYFYTQQVYGMYGKKTNNIQKRLDELRKLY